MASRHGGPESDGHQSVYVFAVRFRGSIVRRPTIGRNGDASSGGQVRTNKWKSVFGVYIFSGVNFADFYVTIASNGITDRCNSPPQCWQRRPVSSSSNSYRCEFYCTSYLSSARNKCISKISHNLNLMNGTFFSHVVHINSHHMWEHISPIGI